MSQNLQNIEEKSIGPKGAIPVHYSHSHRIYGMIGLSWAAPFFKEMNEVDRIVKFFFYFFNLKHNMYVMALNSIEIIVNFKSYRCYFPLEAQMECDFFVIYFNQSNVLQIK